MPPATPGWSVGLQRATTELDPGTGKAVKGIAVSFMTPLGNSGEVFIPQATYNQGVAVTKPLIAAAVANMDAHSKLTGS